MSRSERAARLFGYAAALCLLAMMLIVVADVVLRSAFDTPLFGTFDVVELLLVATIFLALPATFLRQENVVVDLVDYLVPAPAVAWLRVIGLLLGLSFLGLMLFYMVQPALDTLAFGDRTLSLEIPKIIHWLPILFGTGCSILAIIAVLIVHYRERRR